MAIFPKSSPGTRLPGNEETGTGAAAALVAFSLWGLMPIYWKLLSDVNPIEVIGHRGLWSLATMFPVALLTGRMPEVIAALRGKNLLLLFLSMALLSCNWLVFIWAVANGHILETSLGNFVSPLFNMFCGMLFFRDKITRLQWAAVFLVAAAVAVRVITLGHFPWIALGLCVTFSFYGMIRKIVSVESIPGLMVENLLFAPFGIALLIYLADTKGLSFGSETTVTALLVAAGFATSIPMIFFAYAARHLKLTTLGIFHYIVPTCSFILGVFVYHEPFTRMHFITFAIIWLALAMYTVEKFRKLPNFHARSGGD